MMMTSIINVDESMKMILKGAESKEKVTNRGVNRFIYISISGSYSGSIWSCLLILIYPS